MMFLNPKRLILLKVFGLFVLSYAGIVEAQTDKVRFSITFLVGMGEEVGEGFIEFKDPGDATRIMFPDLVDLKWGFSFPEIQLAFQTGDPEVRGPLIETHGVEITGTPGSRDLAFVSEGLGYVSFDQAWSEGTDIVEFESPEFFTARRLNFPLGIRETDRIDGYYFAEEVPVPEPTSLAVVSAAACFCLLRRRKRQNDL